MEDSDEEPLSQCGQSIKEEPRIENYCIYSLDYETDNPPDSDQELSDWESLPESESEDNIEMYIKQEPPLEIEDYIYSSELDPEADVSQLTSDSLQSSSNSNTKIDIYSRCNECKQLFESNLTLRMHFEKQHPDIKIKADYKCGDCEEYFNTTEEAQEHSKGVHKQTVVYGKCRCNVCEQVFTYSYQLYLHFKKVHPASVLKFDYKCSETGCGEFFRRTYEVVEHLKVAHGRDDIGLSYSVPRYLKPERIKAHCNVCEKAFESHYFLTKHFRQIHPGLEINADYKCSMCVESFKSVDGVRYHLMIQHNDKNVKIEAIFPMFGTFRCNLCQRSFKIYNQLRTHFERHHRGFDLKEDYKCKDCEASFPTMVEVPQHWLVTHEGYQTGSTSKSRRRSVNARCNVCEKIFVSTRKLRQHFAKRHPGLELNVGYKCRHCDEFFKTIEEVKSHSMLFHEGKRQRQKNIDGKCRCNVCGQLFTYTYLLHPHFKRYHPDSQLKFDYKCRHCDEFFETTEELRMHSAVVHERRDADGIELTSSVPRLKKVFVNFRCKVCEKIFQTNGLLKRHFKKVHPASVLQVDYKCRGCDEFFPTKIEHMKHFNAVHEGKDGMESVFSVPTNLIRTKPLNARCNLCKLLMLSHYSLARHYRNIHPGLEISAEYKCSDCEQFFSTTEDVRHHLIVAHGSFNTSNSNSKPKDAKPMKTEGRRVNVRCNVCNQLFRSNTSVKEHFGRKHPDFELNVDYKCKECSEFFKTTELVRKHSKLVHEGKEDKRTSIYGKCMCNLCQQLFKNFYTLKAHFQNKHRDVEVKAKYKCRDCEEVFETTDEIRQHWILSHEGKVNCNLSPSSPNMVLRNRISE